jgi:hypothetical protein
MQLIEADDELNLLFGGIYQLGLDGLIDQTLSQTLRLTIYHKKSLPTFLKGYETTSKVSTDASSFPNCGALTRSQICGIISNFASLSSLSFKSLPNSSLPIRLL